MRIDILTLFPEVFESFLSSSIVGRARAAGVVEFALTQIRDFAEDKHGSVDDKPYGGGPGMVMMCGPIFAAVEAAEAADPRLACRVLLTPQGRRLDQDQVRGLASHERLLLICGHYEGYDERIRLGLCPWEISVGDYVLSGGEAAAMVLIDAIVRLLPGAVGDAGSVEDESFTGGLLEYPHYTRPSVFRGMGVPEVLLSGDHARIRAWRQQQRRERTRVRRPDLLSDSGSGPDRPAPPTPAGAE